MGRAFRLPWPAHVRVDKVALGIPKLDSPYLRKQDKPGLLLRRRESVARFASISSPPVGSESPGVWHSPPVP